MLSSAGYGVERLVQADIQSLPYAGECFDAVGSMDVIVHLGRGRETLPLGEFARVLKPSGMLILRGSALDILRSHHAEFAMEQQRFTRPAAGGGRRETGFTVTRTTYANSLLMPVALAKFRVWEALAGGEPSSGVVPVAPWLDRLLSLPLSGRSPLAGGRLELPGRPVADRPGAPRALTQFHKR